MGPVDGRSLQPLRVDVPLLAKGLHTGGARHRSDRVGSLEPAASIALSAGTHPKVVAERVGHSTSAITLDTYSHVIPSLEEEAATRAARMIMGEAG
jgi:integrase